MPDHPWNDFSDHPWIARASALNRVQKIPKIGKRGLSAPERALWVPKFPFSLRSPVGKWGFFLLKAPFSGALGNRGRLFSWSSECCEVQCMRSPHVTTKRQDWKHPRGRASAPAPRKNPNCLRIRFDPHPELQKSLVRTLHLQPIVSNGNSY